MVQLREIEVEGKTFQVVISDETSALLAARAAGRVFVGVLSGRPGEQEFLPARYVVEEPEAADDGYLERVVRRELGLPWIIGESERLLLREFTLEDLPHVPHEETDQEADQVFYTEDKLEAYIRGQYGFYEYGLWAVVRKADGALVGKAGITGCRETDPPGTETDPHGTETDPPGTAMEMGYHIFEPYRRLGYAKEACRMVMDYVKEEYDSPICAVTLDSNTASVGLLKELGFCQGGRDGKDGSRLFFTAAP